MQWSLGMTNLRKYQQRSTEMSTDIEAECANGTLPALSKEVHHKYRVTGSEKHKKCIAIGPCEKRC